MSFNPGLKIGQIINNNELMSIFKCSQQGGMRKSNTTNTLVIVSDYTRGIYHDKWIGKVLHYTGMGQVGNQDINAFQNRTLKESKINGVDVHLFEVMDPGEYTYCGRVMLVDKPYVDIQPDANGMDRSVWMFPIKPVPDNDVKKPSMYVFKDMDDYRKRGMNVDKEYADFIKNQKSSRSTGASLKGKKVKHKVFGEGNVSKLQGEMLFVTFANGEKKSFNYKLCIEKGLIEFI